MKATERVNHVLMTNILHNLIWESFLACQRVPTKLFCKPPTALFNIASFNAPFCKYVTPQVQTVRSGVIPAGSSWKHWCAVCCRIRLLIHLSQCHQTTPGSEFKREILWSKHQVYVHHRFEAVRGCQKQPYVDISKSFVSCLIWAFRY